LRIKKRKYKNSKVEASVLKNVTSGSVSKMLEAIKEKLVYQTIKQVFHFVKEARS